MRLQAGIWWSAMQCVPGTFQGIQTPNRDELQTPVVVPCALRLVIVAGERDFAWLFLLLLLLLLWSINKNIHRLLSGPAEQHASYEYFNEPRVLFSTPDLGYTIINGHVRPLVFFCVCVPNSFCCCARSCARSRKHICEGTMWTIAWEMHQIQEYCVSRILYYFSVFN